MADVEITSKQDAQEILDDKALEEEQLLDELDNEDVPVHIREARMTQLKEQMQILNDHKTKGYGEYCELKTEKDLLDLTTKEKSVVIHFFHSDFKLCATVDQHLEILAEKHFGTKFARVSVTVAKFCVNKLKIQVLPAILVFIDSVIKDRIIGFEEMGNTENISTDILEKRLAKSGVIILPDVRPEENKTLFGFDRQTRDEESDDDDY